jgi:hypothetical protein
MRFEESYPNVVAGRWLLHDDHAPAHTALSIRQVLEEHLIPIFSQSSYSSDISSFVFFLFSKLKMTFKGEDFRQWKT